MFDTTKLDLKRILEVAEEDKLQLPDFQRDYVWGDVDVRSLVASVAKGYPVGSLLTLETGGSVQFKPRLLEGVPRKDVAPQELLLDGQQRITSLYQVLASPKAVVTKTPKNKQVHRFYYLDIKKTLESAADIEEAIVGVPATRILTSDFGRAVELDLSSRDKEFEQSMFPLNQSFDNRTWLYDWRDYWKAKGDDVGALERAFHGSVLENIERYQMPIIKLTRDNSREAICLVFEKVNVGGKRLDAFELVTAIFAGSSFDLREDWFGNKPENKVGRRERILGTVQPRNVLSKVANTDFLQACTLLETFDRRKQKEAQGATGKDLPQVSCKRDALLGLPLASYKKYADAVEEGFVEAGRFANEAKIIWHKDIPYPPLLMALAAVSARLGGAARTAAVTQKLRQWFWCVTLGELYGSSTETRVGRDLVDLVDWIEGRRSETRSIEEAIFQQDRLGTLRTRNSAAYKGLHALLMEKGCRDFITGRPTDVMTFFNDAIDIHHIFPRAWCKKQGISAAQYDSIINKTPLSKHSNIIVGGNAPSVYLAKIEKKQALSKDALNDILRTHLIDPSLLRADDFAAFYAARSEALSALVETAMGKPVVRESGSNEEETDIEDEEDLDDASMEESA